MSVSSQILYLTIISPFMTDIESSSNGTPIRIFPSLLKQILVQVLVQIVHRIVKSEQNQLRCIFDIQPTRNLRTSTITIWNHANIRLALLGWRIRQRGLVNGLRSTGQIQIYIFDSCRFGWIRFGRLICWPGRSTGRI